MAFVTVEDFAGQTEVLVFSDAYETAGTDLAIDEVVAIEGRVSTRENEEPKIVASRIMSFERARRDLVGALEIELDAGAAAGLVEALDRALARHPGPGQVIFKVLGAAGDSVRVLAKGRQVALTRDVLRELAELVGDERVRLRRREALPAGLA
jgi:DNA polymerase-3 subunit alpha